MLFARIILKFVFLMELAVLTQWHAVLIRHLDLIRKKKQHFVVLELRCIRENVPLMMGLLNVLKQKILALHTIKVIFQDHLK